MGVRHPVMVSWTYIYLQRVFSSMYYYCGMYLLLLYVSNVLLLLYIIIVCTPSSAIYVCILLKLHVSIGCRRLIGSPKLQIIFHKTATKYTSLLWKMTYKDKGSYESSPPCSKCVYIPSICVYMPSMCVYIPSICVYIRVYIPGELMRRSCFRVNFMYV